MNYLALSEKFYSIQGEGSTMGIPAIFVRLGGCNLLCKSESWICDTIEVWQKSNKVEFGSLLTEHEVWQLETKKVHLVWTGGEPLLQQNRILSYIKWFEDKYNFKPIMEIETNCTILPNPKLYALVDYWNVSPKLSNSGEPKNKRFIRKVIRYYSRSSNRKVIFKFVIKGVKDMVELREEWMMCLNRSVYLMPAGASQEELSETRPFVMEMCKNHRYRYSERLHIVAWDKATGV